MIAIGRTKWREIKGPCPICGHKGNCTIADDLSVVLCRRSPSDRPVVQRDGRLCWLHRANGQKAQAAAPKSVTGKLSRNDLEAILKEHKKALTPARLQRLADSLGVSTRSLELYGCGYVADHSTRDEICFSFPMFDGQRRPVGIHLRRERDSKKLAVCGSRNGLFIPQDYEAVKLNPDVCDDPFPLLLAVPEGVSNCCAAADLAFRAIGRPSNSGGATYLRDLLAQGDKQDVVIVGDRDETKWLKANPQNPWEIPFWPGIEGGVSICKAILPVCGRLRFAMPPDGIKDLRQWVNGGGLATMVLEVIKSAKSVTPQWLAAAERRLAERKLKERRKPAA